MKIALVGASGQAGSRILDELVRRGHTVTAIVRNPDKVKAASGVTAVRGDVNDAMDLPPLLRGHDAVISSVHFTMSDPALLIGAVKAAEAPRYIVVGGAGSLEVAPGRRLIDTPEFPDLYKAEATAGAAFLDRLKQEPDLNWTFLSPSALFIAGERTGTFRLGTEQLLSNAQGSSISFEDYAVALVDELETPKHERQRFTVGY